MADFSFTTPGLAAYEQMLLSMSTVVARGIGRKALASGAKIIQVEAQRIVNKKTGLLRKSIYLRNGGQVGNTLIYAIDVRRLAFYGKFLEYGTSKMHPYPFMRPAAENMGPEAIAALALTLGTGIQAAWGTTS
jgi:HK97 gp10 family phage protein